MSQSKSIPSKRSQDSAKSKKKLTTPPQTRRRKMTEIFEKVVLDPTEICTSNLEYSRSHSKSKNLKNYSIYNSNTNTLTEKSQKDLKEPLPKQISSFNQCTAQSNSYSTNTKKITDLTTMNTLSLTNYQAKLERPIY